MIEAGVSGIGMSDPTAPTGSPSKALTQSGSTFEVWESSLWAQRIWIGAGVLWKGSWAEIVSRVSMIHKS